MYCTLADCTLVQSSFRFSLCTKTSCQPGSFMLNQAFGALRVPQPSTLLRPYFGASLEPAWCQPGASLVLAWCHPGASLVPAWCQPVLYICPLQTERRKEIHQSFLDQIANFVTNHKHFFVSTNQRSCNFQGKTDKLQSNFQIRNPISYVSGEKILFY